MLFSLLSALQTPGQSWVPRYGRWPDGQPRRHLLVGQWVRLRSPTPHISGWLHVRASDIGTEPLQVVAVELTGPHSCNCERIGFMHWHACQAQRAFDNRDAFRQHLTLRIGGREVTLPSSLFERVPAPN